MFLRCDCFPFGDELFIDESVFTFVVEGDGLADCVGDESAEELVWRWGSEFGGEEGFDHGGFGDRW